MCLGYAVNHDYDCLVFADGDGQHNPDEIPAPAGPILSGTADLVIGFRTFDQMPIYRRFGPGGARSCSSNGSSITDSRCGFRGIEQEDHRIDA